MATARFLFHAHLRLTRIDVGLLRAHATLNKCSFFFFYRVNNLPILIIFLSYYTHLFVTTCLTPWESRDSERASSEPWQQKLLSHFSIILALSPSRFNGHVTLPRGCLPPMAMPAYPTCFGMRLGSQVKSGPQSVLTHFPSVLPNTHGTGSREIKPAGSFCHQRWLVYSWHPIGCCF